MIFIYAAESLVAIYAVASQAAESLVAMQAARTDDPLTAIARWTAADRKSVV